MSRVSVEGGEVVVRLSPQEALAARRRQLRVPVPALRGVRVEPSWWRVLRGAAGRGMWRPGRCVGVRRLPEGEDFVAVKSTGPALCMELGPDAPFRRVAVSVPDPARTERALRAAMPAEGAPDTDPPGPATDRRALLQHEGGIADDHGRPPGAASRTGTGSQPPADEDRIRRADATRVRRAHRIRGPLRLRGTEGADEADELDEMEGGPR
ncbi:hypothetical protein [Streptomyces bambusae]|uniref:hypothetical protein n=1 Tax=Streptomyces bambusae TaxID=1550616 RepID=UPI001CA5D10E|nr:hypothetical protein [Streptomyces bambusae]